MSPEIQRRRIKRGGLETNRSLRMSQRLMRRENPQQRKNRQEKWSSPKRPDEDLLTTTLQGQTVIWPELEPSLKRE